MSQHTITAEVVVALALCPRKAHLLLQGTAPKTASELANLLSQRCFTNQVRQGLLPSSPNSTVNINTFGTLTGERILHTLIHADDIEVYCDILTQDHTEGGTTFYKPTRIIGTYKIEREDMLLLALAAYALGILQRHFPTTGTIICFAGKKHEVQLKEHYKQLKILLTTIRKWLSIPSPDIAPVMLNEHCPHCYYEQSCRAIAETKNDLTLLDRMSPRVARNYQKKGIFTIEQLSFLFRPRRRKKPAVNQPAIHKLELQALAIRSHKIYVHIIPSIERQSTELFLDIEGIPDQDSYYLIGLLICHETTEEFFSYWANTSSEEEHIWLQLVEKVNSFPKAPIYHYGSYESRYASKMIKRHPIDSGQVSERLHNLNEDVYGKIYFPIRSNRLKDIVAFLGSESTTSIASGLQSIARRYLWEDTGNVAYKEELTTYNREDCYAVKILLEELTRIALSSEKATDIDFADNPKQHATAIGEELHDEFKRIMRSAHAGYEQAKITLQKDGDKPQKRTSGAQRGHKGNTRKPTKTRRIVQISPRKECPKCADAPLKETQIPFTLTIIDLVFSNQGCRKVITSLPDTG